MIYCVTKMFFFSFCYYILAACACMVRWVIEYPSSKFINIVNVQFWMQIIIDTINVQQYIVLYRLQHLSKYN